MRRVETEIYLRFDGIHHQPFQLTPIKPIN